ncbi:MAG TPA: hypothetical protein VM779_06035 [Thermoanaerobaculia bacterium]|nr:hypothetical protein [Thermoanaerobaculia bacterium]
MSARQLTLLWICSAVLFGSFFLRVPVLWDLDSYYHLAVARHYVEHGVAAPVPWLRYSLLSRGADKEWLFHLLLMPFAALPDPAVGGRIALALLNATIATAIAAIAGRAVGAAALVLPLWLWIAAPPFFARVIRLRPEMLALLLILCAIPAAAKGRYRLLALLAFAFAAGYTAFHVFVALVVLWAAWRWYVTRRIDWRLIAAALGGTAAGLLFRPHPIENLRLWYVQNVQFFQNIGRLDVGPEIHPPPWPQTLISSSVWIVTLLIVGVLAFRARERAAGRDRDLLPFTAISAAVFVILFLRMGRMATYVYPLLTLTVLLASWQRVRARTAAIVFAAGAVVALPLTVDRGVRDVVLHLSTAVSELDWWSFGRAVPPGAKVAARWADAEAYVFWAPQGRYLNALDPLFMALPYPREYEAQRRLFSGRDPDIPLTLRRVLDSDYLALDWTLTTPQLVDRLTGDPRLEVVYGGYNALFRLREGSDFITWWAPLPPPADAIAAFVDVTSLAKDGCATVRHRLVLDRAARVELAFAPWGPSTLSIDGVERARLDGAPLAILSRAKKIEADLAAGEHQLEVTSCAHDATAGFYVRRLR